MEFIDKNIAEKIAIKNGLTTKKLGLRFDKVVVQILSNLRDNIKDEIPHGTVVLLTITAPIKLPSKTENEISKQVEDLLNLEIQSTKRFTVFQNEVSIRVIKVPKNQTEKFIGFVHNPEQSAEQLLDFAALWLLEH